MIEIIKENDPLALSKTLSQLENKKLISFATDTVYGLAADATSEEAVSKIYNLKKRDANKPIAIFLADINQAKEIFLFDEISEKLARKFLPGPLTLVLKCKNSKNLKIAKNIKQNDEFLGFRIIKSEFVNKILSSFKKPLAVTSSNISGFEAAINAEKVVKYFEDSDILLIDSADCQVKIASTVVKVEDKKMEIIRESAIKKEDLLNI